MTVLRDPLLSCAKLADREPFAARARVAEEPEAHEAVARDADRATIARLYAAHGAAIHRFLCDLLNDAALAADATQETFVRAYKRLDTLRDAARPSPWLFGVARNVSLELRRSRARARRVLLPEGEAGSEPSRARAHGSPEAALLGAEAARVVSSALETMSEDRRAALLLRLDHGLAYEEIAEILGFSLAKVKVEIHRARETLRATLAAYEGGAR